MKTSLERKEPGKRKEKNFKSKENKCQRNNMKNKIKSKTKRKTKNK